MTVYEPALVRDDFKVAPGQPQRRLSTESRRLMLYLELLVLDVSALLAGSLISTAALGQLNQLSLGYFPSLAVIALYVFAAANNGGYSIGALRRSAESVRLAVGAFVPAVLLVIIIAFLLKSSENISRLSFALGLGLGGSALVVMRAIFPRHAARVTQGRLVNELVIVDGKPLTDWINAPVVMDAERLGIRPDLDDPAMLDRFGNLTAAFDRVVIDSVSERHREWALLLKGANVDGEIVMEEYNQFGAIGVGSCDGKASMLVARKPLSIHDRMRKRLLDLAITVPLIILISPLLLLTATAIKLDTRGPVLFKQLRIGRGNRLFQVLKFRSMLVERADAVGNRSTERNDDRVTRVGRFIRATSIDELPQLFNVLLGDMSLVGPRPHTLGSLAGGRLFWHIDVTYWHRHQLKPGITGLAQVRGFRGATHELSDLTNRLQADMEYIQGWDIWRDITILVNTFRVVVHRNAF